MNRPNYLEMLLNGTPANEVHRAVDQILRADSDAFYLAMYKVEATELVNELVPLKNRQPNHLDDWLRKVMEAYGSVELAGTQWTDPVVIFESHGLIDPLVYTIGATLPDPPEVEFCDRCLNWGEVSQTFTSLAVRVVRLLLCDRCLQSLDLEGS